MERDCYKLGVVTVICLTWVLAVLFGRLITLEEKYIAAGYTRKTLQGSACAQWVRE